MHDTRRRLAHEGSLVRPAILLAAVTAPAQAQFAIDLTAGPNWTSISAAPIGFSKSSDIGYFVGGRIRFGHLLYVAPGLNYQYQSFIYNDAATLNVEDNIGISSFMIPVEVGVNLNAQDRGGAARCRRHGGLQHVDQRQRVRRGQGHDDEHALGLDAQRQCTGPRVRAHPPVAAGPHQHVQGRPDHRRDAGRRWKDEPVQARVRRSGFRTGGTGTGTGGTYGAGTQLGCPLFVYGTIVP